MSANQKLIDVIKGRTMKMVTQECGTVVVVFDDHSALRVKVYGSPNVHVPTGGRVASVRDHEAEPSLACEDGSIVTSRVADAGSSVTVRNENNQVEYLG
jgi:hypothetical protein